MKNPINRLQDEVRELKKKIISSSNDYNKLSNEYDNLRSAHEKLIDENIQTEQKLDELSEKITAMCSVCVLQTTSDCEDCPLK